MTLKRALDEVRLQEGRDPRTQKSPLSKVRRASAAAVKSSMCLVRDPVQQALAAASWGAGG